MAHSTSNNAIVLFDGVCHFCNQSVNFIVDRDPKAYFKFAPLQSEIAKEYFEKQSFNPEGIDSIILIKGDRVYVKSRAALEIARRLKGAWPLLYGLVVIPGFLRNIIYDFIARNRYKWFGKYEACRLPTPKMRERYL